MLDGGSGVNSATEELVVQILNEQKEKGVRLDDSRHPIVQLEKWQHDEELRGIVGGQSVPLVGSVVLKVGMLELCSSTGPCIEVRFKICAAGSTDWVGFTLGARALDCSERGGLGHIPAAHSHVFSSLGIQMERIDRTRSSRPDSCYIARNVILDTCNGLQSSGARPVIGPPADAAVAKAVEACEVLSLHGTTAELQLECRQ